MPRATIHKWTEEELEIIRRDYNKVNKDILAQRFGVNRSQVAYQASNMNIQRRWAIYSWKPEDDKKLIAMSKKYNVHTIAKYMGRSCNAIYCRRRFLRLSDKTDREWYTFVEVSKILGFGHNVTRRYIQLGDLKAKRNGPDRQCGNPWIISRKAIKDFIRTFPGTLIGKNVDMIAIVDILAGIKYEGVS